MDNNELKRICNDPQTWLNVLRPEDNPSHSDEEIYSNYYRKKFYGNND